MSICDRPEFYNETYPRARKEHTCCECGGPIRKGEIYARCSGKWDGDLQTHEQHKACRDFAAEVNGKWGDHGECFIPFGGVDDAISSAEDFIYEPSEAVGLRSRWALIRAAGRGEVAA